MSHIKCSTFKRSTKNNFMTKLTRLKLSKKLWRDMKRKAVFFSVLTVQAEGSDDSCVTFVLHDEDHTLGNSLRYMIMKNPEVEFCGYSNTHPSETKINFRIQTRGELPAVEPFRKGLNDLSGVCQHVLNTFETSMKTYKEQKEEAMD
ncbi:DNA-directed RNA polymerases I and III subunit RPAC2 isoform X1 [Acipenser ruthenus]|uniref:DNA-directed RNA polymerases I and III subunit RPAC2 isoform X1 n=1 Tax=Acipenser ruthenus TaxID=7906 RepID=UPI00145B1847|nr:DNA-directed RNA polymerases I and III subunit RPAC2 isoform X1 [Acipenser ruthenus]